jgi:hypothetical protein
VEQAKQELQVEKEGKEKAEKSQEQTECSKPAAEEKGGDAVVSVSGNAKTSRGDAPKQKPGIMQSFFLPSVASSFKSTKRHSWMSGMGGTNSGSSPLTAGSSEVVGAVGEKAEKDSGHLAEEEAVGQVKKEALDQAQRKIWAETEAERQVEGAEEEVEEAEEEAAEAAEAAEEEEARVALILQSDEKRSQEEKTRAKTTSAKAAGAEVCAVGDAEDPGAGLGNKQKKLRLKKKATRILRRFSAGLGMAGDNVGNNADPRCGSDGGEADDAGAGAGVQTNTGAGCGEGSLESSLGDEQ